MNNRRTCIGIFTLLAGLTAKGLAADRTRPDQYQAVNLPIIQEQVQKLNTPKITLKDLNALSARVHAVELSEISPDVLPPSGANRPQGSVQLNKVLIVEPSK
jgi:hypothetical protein